MKKLPDAEFEVMRAVWSLRLPVTSAAVGECLRRTLPDRDWKPQTILTMLTRLEQKGFLHSEKAGKERLYDVRISETDYMQVEADSLRQRFAGGHFSGLMRALCDTGDLTDEDIAALQKLLDERRNT